MLGFRTSNRALAVQLVLLALVFVVLAIVQYRWVDQISDAQQRQLRLDTEDHARAVAEAIGSTLQATADAFIGSESDDIEALYLRWRRETVVPELVEAVFVAERTGDAWQLHRFDPAAGLVPAAWPASFAPLRARLHTLAPRAPLPNWPRPFFGELPALFLVQRTGSSDPAVLMGVPSRVAIVSLSRHAISTTLLPKLTDRMGDSARTYDVAVVRGSEFLARPGHWPASTRFDASAAVPAILGAPLQRRRRLPPAPTGWTVLVRQHGGGVNTAAQAFRTRTVLLAAAIFLVLLASVGMLIRLVRRSEKIRARDVAFVRAITHDLHTPVSILRSAGEISRTESCSRS